MRVFNHSTILFWIEVNFISLNIVCFVDFIIKSHNCCFYQNVSDNIKMSCNLLYTPILCINRSHPSFYLLFMFQFFFCMSLCKNSSIYFANVFSVFSVFVHFACTDWCDCDAHKSERKCVRPHPFGLLCIWIHALKKKRKIRI